MTASLAARFITNHPLVSLGSVATVRRELATDVELQSGSVRMVERVSFDGEIYVGGKHSTKMEQWIAHPGDLLVSKIRARQGSVGLISENHGAVSASIHYRSLIPENTKFDPVYGWLALRSDYCRTQFLAATGGAMKGEISEERLLAINIPLPPLHIQQAIVDYWRDAQQRVADARKRSDAHEQAVMSEFMLGLGLEIGGVGITRRSFALTWSNIDRWSLEFIRQKTGDLDPASGKYPVTTLGDSIADLTNGWSPKCFDRPVQGDEWGVLKLGAVSFGQFNPSENKALPPSLNPRPEYEVRQGDVLISRANITRLVGACAHVAATPPCLMLCDKIFRIVFKEQSPILPRYIAEVMKIPHLRRQIEASVTGSSPTMKNITKPALLALRIPLPPPRIQQQLVDQALRARQDAAFEKAAAEKLAFETANEIESMILGHTPPPKPKTNPS